MQTTSLLSQFFLKIVATVFFIFFHVGSTAANSAGDRMSKTTLKQLYWTVVQVQGSSHVALEEFDVKSSRWILHMADATRAMQPMRISPAYASFVSPFGADEMAGVVRFQTRPEIVISSSGSTSLITKQDLGMSCWRVLQGGFIQPWVNLQRIDDSTVTIHLLHRMPKPISLVVQRSVDSAHSLTCEAMARLAETDVSQPSGDDFAAL